MPKITHIRKNIRNSPWFTEQLRLKRSPLDTISCSNGLVNKVNNCYINSCIQCLAHCEPFAQIMLYGTHECASHRFCPLCEMRRITADILHDQSEPCSAMTLADNSSFISEEFIFGTQQDSHEFLKCLLDKMIAAEKAGLQRSLGDPNQNSTEGGSSLIEQVFSFTTKQRILCSKCGNKSDKYDKNEDLPVQITNAHQEEIHSLNEAMSHYFGSEILDGENAYWCDICNEKTRATKSTSLQEGPNVLVICLKRFLPEMDEETGDVVITKRNHFVKFSRTLDVTPYMHDLSNEEELELGKHQYRLSAFSYHLGEDVEEGHYVSHVFLPSMVNTEEIGGWWVKNDEVVLPIHYRKNISAYLLFYTREDLQSSDVPGPKKKRLSVKAGERRPAHRNLKRKKRGSVSEAEEDAQQEQEQGEVQESKKRVFLLPRLDIPRRVQSDELVSAWEDEQEG